MKIYYDVECLHTLFLICARNYHTKKDYVFEISERKNDLDELVNFFNNTQLTCIGFNSIHYDNILVMKLIKEHNAYKNCDANKICTDLREVSDAIIDDGRLESKKQDKIHYHKYKNYKYNQPFASVDLFLYWSKMLRLSKKLSLKSLAVWLNHDLIQEFDGNMNDFDELIKYCQNDVIITEKLADKLLDQIKLRVDIKNEYQVDCMSWDNIKIASEVLLQDYCRQINSDIKEIRKQKLNRIEFDTAKILKDFNPHFINQQFQDLYNEVLTTKGTFSKEVIVRKNNTLLKLTYGVGGLHSVNKNEHYKSNEDKIVITSDVASLYPNLIINYKCIRYQEVFERYTAIKNERIIAKKAKNKSKDAFLKLCLNGVSGELDNTYSWLYYPEGALKMRLIGQLILTKFIETCVNNNWQVVSANTDGIEVIIDKSDIDTYKQTLDNDAKLFNLDLEHEVYTQIAYCTVNDYIAQTESGKIKHKGMFLTEPEIGSSNDFLIIAKALEAYFINNIKPEEFIRNHKNIYDFCAAKKISKDYQIYWNQAKQQQLNRFYISKKGAYLYKKKHNKNTMENVLKGYGVELFNRFEKRDNYNINYDYYIQQTNSIIHELRTDYQLKLF